MHVNINYDVVKNAGHTVDTYYGPSSGKYTVPDERTDDAADYSWTRVLQILGTQHAHIVYIYSCILEYSSKFVLLLSQV